MNLVDGSYWQRSLLTSRAHRHTPFWTETVSRSTDLVFDSVLNNNMYRHIRLTLFTLNCHVTSSTSLQSTPVKNCDTTGRPRNRYCIIFIQRTVIVIRYRMGLEIFVKETELTIHNFFTVFITNPVPGARV